MLHTASYRYTHAHNATQPHIATHTAQRTQPYIATHTAKAPTGTRLGLHRFIARHIAEYNWQLISQFAEYPCVGVLLYQQLGVWAYANS